MWRLHRAEGAGVAPLAWGAGLVQPGRACRLGLGGMSAWRGRPLRGWRFVLLHAGCVELVELDTTCSCGLQSVDKASERVGESRLSLLSQGRGA